MGKYKRKSDRGAYSKESFQEAVIQVESGMMSGYQASKTYKIPRMTIMDHVKKRRGKSKTLGRNTALDTDIEFKLAMNLHIMEKNGFGLSRAEVLKMVGDYVTINNIITPFKNNTPGKDWFLSFKKRHGLSVKKPQAVEYARKRVMDPFIVYPYFDLLEKTLCELDLTFKPSSIWNLDETSFSKDPEKTKIVGAKGYASTRVISSSGRDNTTVLLGASASGEKTPPMIIYKGKNVWDTWTSPEAYPGTAYAATTNGWMETEVFESFFTKVFLPTIKNQRPVLLIYDGHSTHVGLNIIEKAREENITILKLPPHSSHFLQPLDISVMKPFKDRWDALLVQWQRRNIGTVMPKSEFAKAIGQIWTDLDPQILRNGFRKAGIYPVNRDEIKETQFDNLKLRHWREQNRNIIENGDIIINNPESLTTIVLNFFNNTQIHPNLEFFEEIANCDEQIRNCDPTCQITFEELLLEKVRRADTSTKPPRRKIAPGAEVITHNDVLEKKKEEQLKNTKVRKSTCKRKNVQSKPSLENACIPNTDEDIVYLKNISKNDDQLRPFTAKDINKLPSCLQPQSDSSKIKILSDIVIKKHDKTDYENNKYNIENRKYKTPQLIPVNKEHKISQSNFQPRNKTNSAKINSKVHTNAKSKPRKIDHLDSKDLYNNPKPGSSGLAKNKRLRRRRSSSTTSVSGSISSHSDSDLIDTDTSERSIIMEDSNILPLTNKEDHFETDMEDTISNDLIPTYYADDDVLVRYHSRQKWTYYVGRIENMKLIDNKPFYTIRFYKTIKKPKLIFKITKKVDRDDVPVELIVKKVDLAQDPVTLHYIFVNSNDDNSVYF